MSVRVDDRKTSKAEYVNTAIEIFTRTINFLSRMSARYARLLAGEVAELAGEVMTYSEKANAIFPKSEERVKLKEHYLLEAEAALEALDVHLTQCEKILLLNPQGAFDKEGKNGEKVKREDAIARLDRMSQTLGSYINEERKLLRGIIKANKVIEVKEEDE